MAQTPDGRHLIVADATGRIDLFTLTTGRRDRRLQEAGKDSVHVMAISPDGRWLACGRTRGDVQLWDLTTNKAVRTLNDRPVVDKEREGIVERLAFAPNSKVLFTGINPYGARTTPGRLPGTCPTVRSCGNAERRLQPRGGSEGAIRIDWGLGRRSAARVALGCFERACAAEPARRSDRRAGRRRRQHR